MHSALAVTEAELVTGWKYTDLRKTPQVFEMEFNVKLFNSKRDLSNAMLLLFTCSVLSGCMSQKRRDPEEPSQLAAIDDVRHLKSGVYVKEGEGYTLWVKQLTDESIRLKVYFSGVRYGQMRRCVQSDNATLQRQGSGEFINPQREETILKTLGSDKLTADFGGNMPSPYTWSSNELLPWMENASDCLWDTWAHENPNPSTPANPATQNWSHFVKRGNCGASKTEAYIGLESDLKAAADIEAQRCRSDGGAADFTIPHYDANQGSVCFLDTINNTDIACPAGGRWACIIHTSVHCTF